MTRRSVGNLEQLSEPPARRRQPFTRASYFTARSLPPPSGSFDWSGRLLLLGVMFLLAGFQAMGSGSKTPPTTRRSPG